jgi:glutathione S-transferase
VILIGQYDSPFVRRVAVALQIYGLHYEHRPWSTFGNGDRIAPYNPLIRVPTLVLDDGEVLIESYAILDHLDELAGPARSLIPDRGPQRRRALKVCALATGLADKAVALVYEGVLHPDPSDRWLARCRSQISGALDVLEADRARCQTPFWLGNSISHADIAVACALRFTREAHGKLLLDADRYAALTRHADTCEALPAFRQVVQPLIPPK